MTFRLYFQMHSNSQAHLHSFVLKAWLTECAASAKNEHLSLITGL